MSMSVKEVIRWLSTLSPSDAVGIDEGGLALRSLDDQNVYMEVGGISEDVLSEDD